MTESWERHTNPFREVIDHFPIVRFFSTYFTTDSLHKTNRTMTEIPWNEEPVGAKPYSAELGS